MRVIILAGGAATRLRPLSYSLPKTLIPVCNISLFARILHSLDAAGIRRATVTLPNIGQDPAAQALAAAPNGFQVDIKFPVGVFRGTAAAVRDTLDTSDGSILVIYGDSLLSVDFSMLLAFHERVRQMGGKASILCHRPTDLQQVEANGCSLYGVMSVAKDGRITRFLEKPRVEEIQPGFDIANAAVFIVERALLEGDRFLNAKDFSYDIFQPAASEGLASLYACEIGDGFRYDIGGLRRLFLANMEILNGRVAAPMPARAHSRDVWIGKTTLHGSTQITPPALIGDDVEIAPGAMIGPNVVLGNRCHLGPDAQIRHSVLMDDCAVSAHAVVEYCIIGPRCLVGEGAYLPRYSVFGADSPIGVQGWHT